MEIIAFTVVGIALYLVSDRFLIILERLHGDPLPNRNIIFFVIIVVLALPTFSLVHTLLGDSESPQHNYQEQQATDGGYEATQPH